MSENPEQSRREAFEALEQPFEGYKPYEPEGIEESEADGGIPEIDPRYREPLVGLLFLGRLTESFTLWGHEFVIKTLSTDDLLEVSEYVRPYQGSMISGALLASATLGASVISVDGETLPEPIEVGQSAVRVRADYVKKNWMPPVRDEVYDRYLRLEAHAKEVLEEAGKASG